MNKTMIRVILSSIVTFVITVLFAVLMNKGDAEIVVGQPNEMKPGVIGVFAGTNIPDGYLLCDGSAVSRTTYSNLFAIIGTTYGSGNGSTTFNLPNIAGKVVVGKDESEFTALGQTGGSVNNTLTTSNLPSHSHTITPKGTVKSTFTGTSTTTSENGSHNHSFNRPVWYVSEYKSDTSIFSPYDMGTTVQIDGSTESAGAHTHTVTPTGNVSSTFTGTSASTSSVGSGTSFTNLQPYLVVNYVIKY